MKDSTTPPPNPRPPLYETSVIPALGATVQPAADTARLLGGLLADVCSTAATGRSEERIPAKPAIPATPAVMLNDVNLGSAHRVGARCGRSIGAGKAGLARITVPVNRPFVHTDALLSGWEGRGRHAILSAVDTATRH